MKNKKTILLVSILILLVITILGVSYAAWDMYHVQSGENIVTTKCFEITSDLGTDLENTPITTSEFYPMTDEVGMSTTPFTFTITNVCDSPVNYQINLETLSTSTIDLGAVKATLNNNKARVLTRYTEVDKTLNDATESRKLLSGKLNANESLTYNFRFWMDEKADNTTQNKTYAGKITVVGTLPRVMPVNNCTYDGELVRGAEYSDGTYTYRYKQEGTSSGWQDIIEDGWGVKLTDPSTTGEINTPICTSINGKPIVSMSSMYYNAKDLTKIDVSSFDTSNVVRMNYMFYQTGYNSSSFEIIGLNYLDTSNVSNMSNMFYRAGYSAQNWNIGNLSSWDTSKVRYMSSMFYYAGYKATTFDIGNLSNWDTSKVTDMSSMFSSAGENSTTWSIGDLSSWDTSSVTNMNGLFTAAGYNATTFDIGNLSNWDTSNVTNMSQMFTQAATNATTWNIGDLSNWNTSKVRYMSSMFNSAGYSATTFNIGNLSNWDTANVTNMSNMFSQAGYNATTWNIGDIFNWDTSNVTNISYMFYSAGQNATTWNIGDLSNWDTSNVTNMSLMFYSAGYNATTFDIGSLSNWDTSKVTNMSNMFSRAGYNATTWNSIGTLKVYATNIYQMFYDSKNAKATLNIYSNPASGTSGYDKAFYGASTVSGSLITVNYSSATTNIDAIIATKSSNSNVVKGVQLD